MREKLKFIFTLIILFSIYIFICAYSYVNAVSENLSDTVFRLHVIANSDSNEDQNLKYNVRDALIEYMDNLSENCSSKEAVVKPFCAERPMTVFFSLPPATLIVLFVILSC